MPYSTARQYLLRKHIDQRLSRHPLYTPAMTCIEGVAAVVRGDLLPMHKNKEAYDMSGDSYLSLLVSYHLLHIAMINIIFIIYYTGCLHSS